MLLLPLRAPFCRRSNRHLHHRRADACASTKKVRWGTGDIGLSDGITGSPCGKPALWRVATLARAPPQCVRQRRDSNRFFQWTKYPTSSPPASVEPQRSSSPQQTKNSSAALSTRRPLRTPRSPLCHRCPAHRLVPSGKPRALGRARFRASPGIRVSRSGFRRSKISERAWLRTTKNPPERWLGRVREMRTVELAVMRGRSHEPGRRYRSACSRSTDRRAFRVCGSLPDPCSLANPVACKGAGNTPARRGCQCACG